MKIVFTGGGTAGHIMPSIALIEQLKGQCEIHYIGSYDGMEKEIVSKIKGVTYHCVTTVKLVRAITIKNLAIPFRLIKGINQAKKLLKELQPDIIFSKGGFVALPVTLAAKCPIIAHESDLSIGLSNKLIKKKAKYICTSFKNTAEGLKNGVFTGSPVRKSLYRTKIKSTRPLLLIMGGSLGAKKINDCINDCINDLTKTFDVIHITGRGKATDIVSPHYKQMEFCEDIGALYAKATIALSRAGGSTLFELAALKIPALIIPLPKGVSRGDQVDNAEYFKAQNLCRVLSQESLSPVTLMQELNALLNDESIKHALDNAKNIDGTNQIIQLILKLTSSTALAK